LKKDIDSKNYTTTSLIDFSRLTNFFVSSSNHEIENEIQSGIENLFDKFTGKGADNKLFKEEAVSRSGGDVSFMVSKIKKTETSRQEEAKKRAIYAFMDAIFLESRRKIDEAMQRVVDAIARLQKKGATVASAIAIKELELARIIKDINIQEGVVTSAQELVDNTQLLFDNANFIANSTQEQLLEATKEAELVTIEKMAANDHLHQMEQSAIILRTDDIWDKDSDLHAYMAAGEDNDTYYKVLMGRDGKPLEFLGKVNPEDLNCEEKQELFCTDDLCTLGVARIFQVPNNPENGSYAVYADGTLYGLNTDPNDPRPPILNRTNNVDVDSLILFLEENTGKQHIVENIPTDKAYSESFSQHENLMEDYYNKLSDLWESEDNAKRAVEFLDEATNQYEIARKELEKEQEKLRSLILKHDETAEEIKDLKNSLSEIEEQLKDQFRKKNNLEEIKERLIKGEFVSENQMIQAMSDGMQDDYFQKAFNDKGTLFAYQDLNHTPSNTTGRFNFRSIFGAKKPEIEEDSTNPSQNLENGLKKLAYA
jgi:hypothetical protein